MFSTSVRVSKLQETDQTMSGLRKLAPVMFSVCLFVIFNGKVKASEKDPEFSRVVAKEGSDAILPCSLSTEENIEFKVFDWRKDGQKEVFSYDAGIHSNNGRSGQDEQFKGRVSHFPDQLKNGITSIKIQNTKVADSGNYTCVFPRLQPRQTFHIELVVVDPEFSRVVVKAGSDAILPCSLSTKENIEFKVFDWRKESQKEVFSYDGGIHSNNGRSGQDSQFKGRVSHFPDQLKNGIASIKIQNTKVADRGNYTCDFPRLQPSQTFLVELLVVDPEFSRVVVKEGSDAILPCSLSTKENIESALFDWKKDGQKEVFFYDAGFYYDNGRSGQDEQFKGRVSHFPDQLKNGNASIKIQNTKVADRGNYTCVFPRLQPSQTFHIELVVVVGAAPKPHVKILDATKDWARLQCDVQGASPKPKVEWKDRAGNILPAEEPQVSYRGERYYITLLTTVTKIDHYHCVVTQEEIHHQTEAETFVFICGAPTGWIVDAVLCIVVVLLLVSVVGGVLYVKRAYDITPKKSRRPHEHSYEIPVYS